MKLSIRLLYLYLFSFIGLIMIVMSSARLVDLGLKVFIFKDADKFEYYSPKIPDEEAVDPEIARQNAEVEQKRSRQRELSNSISMIVIGVPLYIYHWNLIKKESSESLK